MNQDKTDMGTIEDAIVLATRAHAGAKDKGGAPYIFHPLRIMLKMQTPALQIAAVLHDVVEDSEWTLEGLRKKGFGVEIINIVDHLTRRDGESYEDFVQRAASHPLARIIKIADVEDNLDLTRIKDPTERDHSRIKRYEHALNILKKA